MLVVLNMNFSNIVESFVFYRTTELILVFEIGTKAFYNELVSGAKICSPKQILLPWLLMFSFFPVLEGKGG